MPSPRPRPRRSPVMLRIAAGVLAMQGAVLGALAVLELANLTGGRLTMGLTTSVFFAGVGAALIVVATGLARAASWSRSPAVLAQLLQLGVAWSFRGGGTTLAALVMVALAAVVLVGVLNPASTEALVGPTGTRED